MATGVIGSHPQPPALPLLMITASPLSAWKDSGRAGRTRGRAGNAGMLASFQQFNGCTSSFQWSLTTFRQHHRNSVRFSTPRIIGKQTIYSRFHRQLCGSIPESILMLNGSSLDHHTSPFYLKLGFSIHSVVCRRIQGAGETGEELDDADDADDSGGRRASKTLLSSLQEMANDCRQHYGALDTLADFRR